jgi:uncharacterized membrane protein
MFHGGPYRYPVHLHHGHPLLWLVVLAVLATLFIVALRALWRASGRAPGSVALARWPSGHDAALDSVRLRYARGEIDRDEFARISTDLGAAPPAPA